MSQMVSSRLALASWFCLLPAQIMASEMKIAIRTDFPGGNVLVVKNEGAVVHLAPNLRGGPPWFYWHFEAEAAQPGAVTFFFAKPPMIGVRGPAVSRDGGKSWQWLGADQVKFAPSADKDKLTPRHDSFSFAFTEAKQKVRFAVAIPYLQRELDDFLDKHKANPHLRRSILTQSRLGRRPVDLVQVGKPGLGVKAILLTARHHACESMASYVLEGFLREAMSEYPAGVDFRKKYVLYAVPIVDRDGVEEGDQGKNRLPRDYNRDYGNDPIYPEIKAIQELAELKKVQLSLDLHCPFLRGDIHEAFYFLGLGLPHIKDNLGEWTAWLKEERPQIAMTPLDLLTDSRKPNAANRSINSHYFATRENALFAVTLEVPYAQLTCPLDAALAREYGVSLLKAWVRTEFLPANANGARGSDDHSRLLELRAKFVKTYRSQPNEAEELANPYLDVKTASPVQRTEANNLMALLRFWQKRFPEAMRFAETAGNDAHATTYQKATSASLRLQIACSDPKSSASDVEARLAESLWLPYPSLEHQAKAFEVVGEFFHKRQDYDKALGFVQKQREVAPGYEKGKLLNRMATLQDRLKRPEDAVASRKEAVKILRARLGPVPERSIFGALMTVDLFEALVGIPTATLEEKRAAAALVLDHDVVSAAMKKKVRQALAELEAQPK
jgi:hypothetical protein